MTMFSTIPEDWSYDPPRILVVGEGPFSQALSQLLDARLVIPLTLESETPCITNRKIPRVLNELSRVFVIVSADRSAAEAACIHDSIWKWVITFTEEKEEHLLAVHFILPESEGIGLRGALMASLALSDQDCEQAGFGFSCMSDGLSDILAVTDRISLKDFVALRNRRNADIRRIVVEQFRTAVVAGDAPAIKQTAESVSEVFYKEEHLLDVFCRKPSHRNGHRLRFFLNQVVTNAVTQELRASLSLELPDILI